MWKPAVIPSNILLKYVFIQKKIYGAIFKNIFHAQSFSKQSDSPLETCSCHPLQQGDELKAPKPTILWGYDPGLVIFLFIPNTKPNEKACSSMIFDDVCRLFRP